MEIPDVRYAWNGDVALAYQVFGDGPVDLVYLQGGAGSHVDLNWESPYLARFLRGLGELARVIVTDRRGWGCSDRFSPGDVAPLEVQVDDLVAVMDAVGAERSVLFGSFETALPAMLFAATSPERTAGLVLCDPFASYSATEETPWTESEEQWEEVCEKIRAGWGTPEWSIDEGFTDERERLEWFVPFTRAAVAPGALVAEVRAFYRADVRAILPTIHVPTLVVGIPDGEGWQEQMVLNPRFVAERILGARLIEPSTGNGAWFHWYARAPAVLDAVAMLIGSIHQEFESFDRVLATVLFTDIVDSTQRATAIGDAEWKELLEQHHSTVRSMIARYKGTEVDTAGDGFLATFDGPARGVKCAQAIADAVRPLGLEIRAGLHTGEVETIDGKVGGIAVHIGARVGALAGASEVWVSSTVKDLVVGSGLDFEDRGEHELKGVPDTWHLYRVAG